MDATDRQGHLVIVRRMQNDSLELHLLRQFSRPEMRAHRSNHCSSIIGTFDDPADSSATFVITPYLAQITRHSWWRIDSFLEFGAQVLEVRP